MNRQPHRRLFSHYPLFQLVLAFASGIIVSDTLFRGPNLPIILGGVGSVLALVAFARKMLRVAGLTLLSAVLFSGAALAIMEKHAPASNSLKGLLDAGVIDEDQPVLLTGVLDEPPEFARDRLYLLLRLEHVTATGYEGKAEGLVSLLATFKTDTSEREYHNLDLHYGTRICARVALNFLDQYRNPGVSTLSQYLYRKGYDSAGVLKSPTAIKRLDDVAVCKPVQWLYRWRESLQRQIDERFSSETASVLDASLLGNRHNLSRTTLERFREGGTFHVLVISGVHISFIGGIVFLLTQRFTRNRFLQFLISSLVVWGYSVAVGAEASVVRAALMFTFVALGSVLFRSASALNALGGAALLLLLRSPKDLFDPSLQLTFLSVFAIVTVAWPLLQTFKAIGSWRPTGATPYPPACSRVLKTICEVLYWSEVDWMADLKLSSHTYRLFKSPTAVWLEKIHLQRMARYIFNALVVSAGVQVVLLPFLIVYFHRLSISSLLLNIFVSVALAVLGSIAMIALVISQLSVALAQPLFLLANLINWVMVHSVDPFSSLGVASVRLPEYTGWSGLIYLLYYVPLIVLLVVLSQWRPLKLTTPSRSVSGKWIWCAAGLQIALLFITLLHPMSSSPTKGKLRVDFLDVGQGDAVLLTMPEGTTMLVDAGGRPSFASPSKPENFVEREVRSIGEMVVAEHLWWRGLDTIDYVLASHADADHIDGLNDVVRNFSVRSALVARTPADDTEYSKFAQTLATTGTHVEQIQAGDELRLGSVTATVLWPRASNDPSAPSRNNDSVVLRLQFGQHSILLTGDIEKEAEAQLLAAQTNLRVDVMKVPHHGSHTSSTEAFVSATTPKVAIISVGRKSVFGHPHKEVVERWSQSGAEVLTTGNCGMISVITDGQTLTVKKFAQ